MDFIFGLDDNAPDFVESGTYPATVKKATEKISKGGNAMLEIIWRLDNGLELFDHIVDHPATLCRKKSDQFLVAIGKKAAKGTKVPVEAGELDGQRVNLIIELANGKNEVKGYALVTEEPDSAKSGLPF